MASAKGKRVLASALALGAAAILAAATLALATHPRPKGATPIRVSLVPAYEECTAPNRTHGPPLAFPSCSPPVQSSDFLTVGTPDANGAPANSMGFVKLKVLVGAPGSPSDSEVLITTQITDVRCKAGTSACGSANAADGPDYTGELSVDGTLRITDHNNAVEAGGGTDPATVVDIPFPASLFCASTSDTSVGSTCTISSGPLIPNGGCRCKGHRTVVEFSQLRVFDGGPDGIVATEDNTVFMRQGVFIP